MGDSHPGMDRMERNQACHETAKQFSWLTIFRGIAGSVVDWTRLSWTMDYWLLSMVGPLVPHSEERTPKSIKIQRKLEEENYRSLVFSMGIPTKTPMKVTGNSETCTSWPIQLRPHPRTNWHGHLVGKSRNDIKWDDFPAGLDETWITEGIIIFLVYLDLVLGLDDFKPVDTLCFISSLYALVVSCNFTMGIDPCSSMIYLLNIKQY